MIEKEKKQDATEEILDEIRALGKLIQRVADVAKEENDKRKVIDEEIVRLFARKVAQ